MQVVTMTVAMMMMTIMARLEPMDKDGGSDGDRLGTDAEAEADPISTSEDGGGRRGPGSISLPNA